MNKEDKFMVINATDIICIGGLGNLKGNLELLKYSDEEIVNMIKENNNSEDNIKLVLSLLKSIRELQNNRNELKEWLKDEKPTKDMNENFIMIRLSDLKNKMQEIESR